MKKVKVENYKKPNYSTLKMVTGKILPAGLVVATMITSASNVNVQANETAKTDYSINETTNIPVMGGGAPGPYLVQAIEEKPVTVLINQTFIDFDVEPVLKDGRVLVPLRKIFETLGATVTWDGETNTATAIKGKDTIVIAVNDTKMLKNGEEVTLDTPAKIVGGRLLVPMNAVADGLDCVVLWDEINNQVVIECEEEQDIYITAGVAPIVDNEK